MVSYIVRSVHALLRSEFGLKDGLADTATWEEMAERHERLRIPNAISQPEIWAFTIGGYRPAEKWLKDRKGRMLSDDARSTEANRPSECDTWPDRR